MARTLIIRDVVDDDLEEAATWYDRLRAGLGQEFLDCVEEALDRLAKWPDLGIVVYKSMRRISLKRFPYGMFDTVHEDRIEVLAVVHSRRSPRMWKKRLPDN